MRDRPAGFRVVREKAVVALLLLAIALTASLSGALRRVDHVFFDLGQQLFRKPIPSDFVVVMIDEDSLERIGRWPWSRTVHARFLEALCEARPAAVGFDIAFSEPQSPVADAGLAEAVRRCGNVVLPLVLETGRGGGQILESPPIPELRGVVAGLGRVGVRIEEDGMVRAVDLREGVGAAAWPLFAEELLRVGNTKPAVGRSGTGKMAGAADAGAQDNFGLVQHGRRRLQFFGPPGTFPMLSYADVLEAQVPTALIAGKTVFVGATAMGLGDLLPTPVSAHAQPMPGVEIQANVWLGLRSGRLVEDLPATMVALISAALALVPLLWLSRLMPSGALVASVLWLTVPVVLSLFAQLGWQRWFPPMGAVVAGFFAYPLWSWQRLEAARRHLDLELRELNAVIPDGWERETTVPAVGRMGFEQRIAWVQAARQRMQHLETQRKDALAFISHDLRSPLASAVLWLESEPDGNPARLLPPLRRAYAMAQDFLRLARAEALDPRQMKTLDLVFVLHQAADEVFLAARERGQRIERCLPDDPVWILADFESVERCAINLLQNAVSHGKPESVITLGLDVDGLLGRGSETVRFWVENEGPALAPEQLDRLFQKFGRGDNPNFRASGAGLGLFFVRTVATRHGGNAGAQHVDGQYRFWVRLPAERGMP